MDILGLVGIEETNDKAGLPVNTTFKVNVIHRSLPTLPYVGACTGIYCYGATTEAEFTHKLDTSVTSAKRIRPLVTGESRGTASRTAFTINGNTALYFTQGRVSAYDINTAMPPSIGNTHVNKATIPLGASDYTRYAYASVFSHTRSLKLAVTTSDISTALRPRVNTTNTNVSVYTIEALLPFICVKCPSNQFCLTDTLPVSCPGLYVTNTNTQQQGSEADCQCIAPGTWEPTGGQCELCPEDFYCTGFNNKLECPVDSISIPRRGARSVSNCEYSKGYYFNVSAQRLIACPVNHYCLPGVGNTPTPCPSRSSSSSYSWQPRDCICNKGTYYEDAIAGRPYAACITCPMDNYCMDNDKYECPGTLISEAGSSHQSDCLCPAGTKVWSC